MGKIGDLFVRLGLKKEEFSRGLAQAKSETANFGERIGGTFNKVKSLAVAVWAAIGASAVKLFSDVIQHSQRFGDVWANTMNGCKAAWSSFLTSLTNWDWQGFGDRMRNAMESGKASSAAHDAAFEVENSIKLRKAKMREELALLRVEMMDQNKSYSERIKAAEDYLAKVKPLYDEEIALRARLKAADLNKWLGSNGFEQNVNNRENLETLLTKIAPNEPLMNALDNETKKNTGKDYKLSAEDNRILEEFFKSYGERVGGTLAAMASAYIGSGDKEATEVVDAIYGLYEAQAAFDEETRRIQNVKNTASAAASSASLTQAADTGKEYLNQIKPLYEEVLALRQSLRDTLNDWLSSNGFEQTADNRKLLESLYSDIASNESLMNALSKVGRKSAGKAENIPETADSDIGKGLEHTAHVADNAFELSSEEKRTLEDFFRRYGEQAGNTLAEMASAYIGNGSDDTKKVVDAISALNEAQTTFKEEASKIGELSSSDSVEFEIAAPIIDTAVERVQAAFSAMNQQLQYEKEESARIEAEWLEDFTGFSEELQPILDQIQDGINGIDVSGIEEKANTMQIVMEDLVHALEEGLISAFDELANVIAGVEESDFGTVMKALLTPIADMAIKAGTVILMSGEAIEALKTAMSTMGGYGAIIAGAGLVAVGIAAKAGLASIGGGGSTSATTSSGSGSYTGSASTASTTAELVVYVKGSIKGSDIYLSGQNTLNEWNK